MGLAARQYSRANGFWRGEKRIRICPVTASGGAGVGSMNNQTAGLFDGLGIACYCRQLFWLSHIKFLPLGAQSVAVDSLGETLYICVSHAH